MSRHLAPRILIVRLAALFFLSILSVMGAWGAAISSNGSGGGDWNDIATWNGGIVPGVTDQVTILIGDAVALTIDNTVDTLTITGTLAVGANTLTAASISGTGTLTISTGTIDSTGTINVATITASDAASIFSGGDFSPTAFTASTSTVNLDGATTPVTAGGFAYNNLTVSKIAAGNIVNLAALASVGGNLTVTLGTLNLGGNLSVTGNLTGAGIVATSDFNLS
ncbi:MAG: hypothetical protein RBT62_09825, partial [Spirochaetia bacterium]|nr:hypothetical protein [Spirochaetia bacterium]